jgi:hypothetical protein
VAERGERGAGRVVRPQAVQPGERRRQPGRVGRRRRPGADAGIAEVVGTAESLEQIVPVVVVLEAAASEAGGQKVE